MTVIGWGLQTNYNRISDGWCKRLEAYLHPGPYTPELYTPEPHRRRSSSMA